MDDKKVVQVPVSLLLEPGLMAATKVVWMAVWLQHADGAAAIQACTGLSRPTVLSAAHRVRQSGAVPGGARVRVPGALLAEPEVGARAKILYGLLQTIPEFRGYGGQFTYASLCTQTHLSRNALKGAIAELAGAQWIQLFQLSRYGPIRFALTRPALVQGQEEVAAALKRLKRAKFRGEALMKEWLTLLIDSTHFSDNARPGFLVNPLTGEQLELDRSYLLWLACEYNGEPHESADQHLRDLIKAGLCVCEGIRLVIIHSEDLCLEGMLRKIGPNVPLRDLSGHEALIEFLEDECFTYRAAAPREA